MELDNRLVRTYFGEKSNGIIFCSLNDIGAKFTVTSSHKCREKARRMFYCAKDKLQQTNKTNTTTAIAHKRYFQLVPEIHAKSHVWEVSMLQHHLRGPHSPAKPHKAVTKDSQ